MLNFLVLDRSDTESNKILEQKDIIHLTKILNSAYNKTIAQELLIPEGLTVENEIFQTAVKKYHQRLRKMHGSR